MNQTATQSDQLLSWMAGLADATRLRLLRLLERHELGVADLCDILQMPQSTVSRHLKVLSDQSWVIHRRCGTTNLYHTLLDELDPVARSLWLLTREQTDSWPSTRQDQVRLSQRLSQRRQHTRDFFEGAAGDWDRIREELYGSDFSIQALLALLPAHWTVADLGCGTGWMSGQLARHVRQVVAVDQSPAMLKAAAARVQGLANVTLLEGDLEALPLEDQSCDAATLSMVLTYLAQPGDVLAEARRILKPGGKLVLVDLLAHDREDFRRQMGQACLGFTEEQLRELLREAGFARTSCQALAAASHARGPALLLATGLAD